MLATSTAQRRRPAVASPSQPRSSLQCATTSSARTGAGVAPSASPHRSCVVVGLPPPVSASHDDVSEQEAVVWRGGEERALTALAAPRDGGPRPRAAGASETHTLGAALAPFVEVRKSQAEEKPHQLIEGWKMA